MATTRDYYEILGLTRGASDEDIKRAFRKQAQRWHPDVNTDPDADARFKEINEAYQVLADPGRRQAYDMFGRAGVGGTGAGPEGFGPFGGFGGFGDIFDAFFGGAATTGGRRPRRPSGADLRYDLRLTFEEAVFGTEKEVTFTALDTCETCAGTGAEPGTQPVACPQCGGSGELRQVRSTMLGQVVNVTTCGRCQGAGQVAESACQTCRGDGRTERQRTLRVTVPAGIDEGHQVRLSGEGEAGPRGGARGNLYVVTHVDEHPVLKRDGTELYEELKLSYAQAALGAEVTIVTPDGEETLEVKPGTQPGTEIRRRGKGVPHLRRPGTRGDLHILVDVVVPTRLTARQRELLEELAVESGEVAVDVPGDGAGDERARSGSRPRARRRKRTLGDRIKDVIG
jgi:molecular chaperone DnaJ